MPLEALPNAVAMATSLAAIVVLSLLIPRIGGQIGWMLRLIVAGVFLSVFVHAAVELAEIFGLVTAGTMMVVMGTLLSLGSVAFFAAGVVGLRAMR